MVLMLKQKLVRPRATTTTGGKERRDTSRWVGLPPLHPTAGQNHPNCDFNQQQVSIHKLKYKKVNHLQLDGEWPSTSSRRGWCWGKKKNKITVPLKGRKAQY